MKANKDIELMKSLISETIDLLNNPTFIEEVLASKQARYVPLLNISLSGREWIEIMVATAGKCFFENREAIEAGCPGLGDRLTASWARYMSSMSLRDDLGKINYN